MSYKLGNINLNYNPHKILGLGSYLFFFFKSINVSGLHLGQLCLQFSKYVLRTVAAATTNFKNYTTPTIQNPPSINKIPSESD